ncbi:DMT family transporter [Massilia sp. LC238]|uniref:DMT family transporter n=1 Tax=Massilia sp. LC238 TaxID=1502852 RepID=UPI0004E40F33|nr:EamA family transporter [Massilia sp. LC238]KFC68356.1 putative membrane spanning protein [Massilia sp. LC238]
MFPASSVGRAAQPETPFFARPLVVVALATLCCLLWGSSYPAIKTGYALLGITQQDIPSKLVYAGYRFLLAGIGVALAAWLLQKKFPVPPRGQLRQVFLLGIAQTSLQYVFFYIGLAYTTGVRASILNATTTFFSVLLAHFLYKDDRLSARKAVGCALGLAGVLAVNADASLLGSGVSLQGEGFIVLAAFVLSAASIYGKRVSQRMDAMTMTAWQLAIGGLVLLAAGYLTGGSLGQLDLASSLLLVYLAALSAVAFTLWSLLLKHNPVGLVSMFAFLVPLFGAALSGIWLDEDVLTWTNLAALVLVCGGVLLVTRGAPAGRPAPRQHQG